MSLNFEEFAEATNLSLINMSQMIKKGKEEAELNAVNKSVEFIDELKTKFSIMELNYELLKNNQTETDGKVDKMGSDYLVLKDATYVIATDDGKRKELTKLINSLVYSKYTGRKNSLKDKLFHKTITENCYKRIYAQFEINTYTRIKIDDFEEAKKVVLRFYNNEQNIRNTVYNRLQEYIKNEKILREDVKKLVDDFMDKSNGGNNLFY